MTGIQHLEAIVSAAIATLRSDLNAEIDVLNAEAGAPFSLDHVASDQIDFSGFPLVVYPCIEVAAPDWTMSNFSLAQLVADMACPVIVRAVIADPASSTLHRRCLRYGRAILSVLVAPGAFGSDLTLASTGIGARGAYRFNPESGEKEDAIGHVLLAFNLAGQEDRL